MLVEISRDRDAVMGQVAASIGITERSVQNIVADLCRAGYLTRHRVGGHNRYTLNLDRQFRHPAEAGLPVRVLIDVFADRDPGWRAAIGRLRSARSRVGAGWRWAGRPR
ncbi:MarR family transcriptional regulator [Nonomuraea jiangxiensis]|uniref:MarR family protein n=1 Tax=Nonomuraea jiangxiensis TaxID=633440 RepID=A0A1G9KWB4_9ACTN|nr:MarR family transcriptional regulator [Nonomuraea jiangxiensis]SDL54002.1 hypothetical protein SAMN05421869_12714 [Nonomuraea jiangxiensis]